MSERECQKTLQALEDLDWDWLVASGSLPRGVPKDFYVQVSDLVAARKGKLVLDTSGEPLRLALDHGGLALVKPSHGEFEKLTGRTLATPAEIGAAAVELIGSGKVEMVAVTLGHDGAVLATKDGWSFLPAPKVETISTSGAGDSFVAGMVHALAIGWRPDDAFRLARPAGPRR